MNNWVAFARHTWAAQLTALRPALSVNIDTIISRKSVENQSKINSAI